MLTALLEYLNLGMILLLCNPLSAGKLASIVLNIVIFVGLDLTNNNIMYFFDLTSEGGTFLVLL